MPSKYGFGNTRTASPYKLASYGNDQKNPIQMKGSPTKQLLPILKAAGKATKWIAKKIGKKKSKKVVNKPTVKVNPAKTPEGKYAEFTKEISNNPELSKKYNELFIKNMNKYYKLSK